MHGTCQRSGLVMDIVHYRCVECLSGVEVLQ